MIDRTRSGAQFLSLYKIPLIFETTKELEATDYNPAIYHAALQSPDEAANRRSRYNRDRESHGVIELYELSIKGIDTKWTQRENGVDGGT